MTPYNHPEVLAKGLELRLERTRGLDNRVHVLRWTKEARDLANRPKYKIVGLLMRFITWMKNN